MKNIRLAYRMAVMIPFIGLLINDFHCGFRHLLSVCKRIKAKAGRRVLNEYKRLCEDINTDSQGFIKFGRVADVGELRIYTS